MIVSIINHLNLPWPQQTAEEIRRRIKSEIGDWLMVSIGIGPNRWLAKMGAGLDKPNGLNELNWWNIETILARLQLEDLHGISRGNAGRLRRAGLLTPLDMYRADIPTLGRAFHSILGLQWHLKMHGYEAEDRPVNRQSFSHVYSLPNPVTTDEELAAVMSKMAHSLGYRIRRAGYRAKGLFIGLNFDDGQSWFHHSTGEQYLYDSADLYASIMQLVALRPSRQPVRRVSSGCFGLESAALVQTTYLEDRLRKQRRVAALDKVQTRFGKYAIMPARMLDVHKKGWLKDAISFGGIGELESLEFEEIEVEKLGDAEARFWEEA
jgi:DNA polymerase-4